MLQHHWKIQKISDDSVETLDGHMNPRAMLAVMYATGRASHARQVNSDNPDHKVIPWSSRLGVGHGANPTL
jgi:hypothetical protein